jgi:hypothetical protein
VVEDALEVENPLVLLDERGLDVEYFLLSEDVLTQDLIFHRELVVEEPECFQELKLLRLGFVFLVRTLKFLPGLNKHLLALVDVYDLCLDLKALALLQCFKIVCYRVYHLACESVVLSELIAGYFDEHAPEVVLCILLAVV